MVIFIFEILIQFRKFGITIYNMKVVKWLERYIFKSVWSRSKNIHSSVVTFDFFKYKKL